MKNVFFFLMSSLLLSNLSAQNCAEVYSVFSEGAEVHYKHFDKKDELSATSTTKISKMVSDGGKVTATFESEIFTEKKKKKDDEPLKNTYSMTCENDILNISIESMLSPETMGAYKDMEIEIDGTPMTLPTKMTVGQSLDDANVDIQVKTSGMTIFKTTISFTNRKVEAEETIKTEAGSFLCKKISYDSETKLGFIKKIGRTVEWQAAGIGMVRTESYDKKDKLESYSELSFLKK